MGQQFSKKQVGVLAGVLLAVAAAVPLAYYSGVDMGFGSNGGNWSSPLASTFSGSKPAAVKADATPMQRLMAMFDARSPGERTTAELAATKFRKATERRLALNTVPRQRALGKVIQPRSVPSQQFVNAITPAPVIPVVPQGLAQAPLGEVLAPIPAAFTPVVGGVLIPPVGGGGFGGGGGGGGTPGVPGTPLPPVVEVTPAVPEPSTWLMMLFGFGMIGSAMRRRGALAAAPLAKA